MTEPAPIPERAPRNRSAWHAAAVRRPLVSEGAETPHRGALAARSGGIAALLRSLFSQWTVERRLRRRATCYRTVERDAARTAYESLTAGEFAAINAPQQWTNRHLIPRAVAGLLPPRPAVIVDLGCGSGDSTAVLARCSPAGSQLLGYDFSRSRLQTARSRRYWHANGAPAAVAFRCQPIDETLCAPPCNGDPTAGGSPLPPGSVDLAHSSGVVGHHLERTALQRLAAELRRIVRPGGAVVLDAGPSLRAGTVAAILSQHGFAPVGSHRLMPFNPRAQLSFRLCGQRGA